MKRFISMIAAFVLLAVVTTASAGPHFVCVSTGSVAIASSCTVNNVIRVKQVTIHLSVAPTTSEKLTIKLDANAGAVYDTDLHVVDPSDKSLTDIVWVPDGGALLMVLGDSLDITYANTDARTYGIQVYYELVQ